MGCRPTPIRRGEGPLGPCWVHHLGRWPGSERATDLHLSPCPPPCTAQREGTGSGTLSGGWKRPGLCFGILPISDLAEGWGCGGPWPLAHTPPMTGSSLRRKLDSRVQPWVQTTRCPLPCRGVCVHMVQSVRPLGVEREQAWVVHTQNVQGQTHSKDALCPEGKGLAFPPTAPEVSPLARSGEPCCLARRGRKRRGQVLS